MSDVENVDVNSVGGDATILDVREDYEWEAGHIAGAVHIPLNELPLRLDELDPDVDLHVVCRSGGRSFRATEWLNSNGYSAVNVHGGMGPGWTRASRRVGERAGAPGPIMTSVYTFLGPERFTEAALLQVPGALAVPRIPASNVEAALDAVRSGEAGAAMVPIENSVEGGVSATLDAIAAVSRCRSSANNWCLSGLCWPCVPGPSARDLRGLHPIRMRGPMPAWCGENIPQAAYLRRRPRRRPVWGCWTRPPATGRDLLAAGRPAARPAGAGR